MRKNKPLLYTKIPVIKIYQVPHDQYKNKILLNFGDWDLSEDDLRKARKHSEEMERKAKEATFFRRSSGNKYRKKKLKRYANKKRSFKIASFNPSKPNYYDSVFLDFDQTIASKHVYHNLNYISRNLEDQVKYIRSLNKKTIINEYFGGEIRFLSLYNLFNELNQQNIKIFICSDGYGEIIRLILNKLNLDTFFTEICARYTQPTLYPKSSLRFSYKWCNIQVLENKYGLNRPIFVDDDINNLEKECPLFSSILSKRMTILCSQNGIQEDLIEFLLSLRYSV